MRRQAGSLGSNVSLTIIEEPVARAAELATISIAFAVDTVLDVVARGRGEGANLLSKRPLEAPYVKDYDAIAGEGPSSWSRRFNLANWGLLSAYESGTRIGGAVVACNTPGIELLEGRADLAVLWDIRVAPEARRRGVGISLFRAAETWARSRGMRQLKIETQQINVGACRFYERMGCDLRKVNRFAYPESPGEIQLLWYKDLVG